MFKCLLVIIILNDIQLLTVNYYTVMLVASSMISSKLLIIFLATLSTNAKSVHPGIPKLLVGKTFIAEYVRK